MGRKSHEDARPAKLSRKKYEKGLARLQAELVKLQYWPQQKSYDHSRARHAMLKATDTEMSRVSRSSSASGTPRASTTIGPRSPSGVLYRRCIEDVSTGRARDRGEPGRCMSWSCCHRLWGWARSSSRGAMPGRQDAEIARLHWRLRCANVLLTLAGALTNLL